MTLCIPMIAKSKEYGRLVPEKITRVDGRSTTYWVSPEDRNEGHLKGQADLFTGDSAGGPSKNDDRGYFDHLDRGVDDYQIKPLIGHVETYDPELAKRIEAKYKNYQFDRDTKEEDIEVDYQTAWYLKKMKDNPQDSVDYQREYHEKTDKAVVTLNNRKTAMLKLKKGSRVRVGQRNGVVEGFSRRGFPLVRTGNTVQPVFYEELSI